MYGLLMAHPGRVSADHARGDFEAFKYARPALRMLLAAAAPFDGRDPAPRPGDDRLGRP